MSMLADYHVHSEYSYDCDWPLDGIVLDYARLGFDEICVTDHMEAARYPHTHNPDFAVAHERMRSMESPVGIRCGVEVTMYDDVESEQEIAGLLAPLRPDFIVGSLHEYGREVYWDRDPFRADFYANRTRQEAYRDYIEMMARCAERHSFFDVIAHFAYPQKYAPYADKMLRYSDAPEEIDAVYRAVIARGAGIELNTSAMGVLPRPAVDVERFRRYRELGGEIITIGTDSHAAATAGRWVKEAQVFLREAGFAYFCTFKERQPIFHKL